MDKEQMWEAIRAHYKLTRNIDFAKHFGITEQTANNWMNRGVMHFEKIYSCCPDISPDWLLSHGERGPMLRPANQSINGNHNTQVGGDFRQECSESLSRALEMLEDEKEENKRLRGQIDGLLTIVQNLTASKEQGRRNTNE